MKSGPSLLGVIAISVTLTLAGCGSAPESAAPSTSPSAEPQSTATAVPSPEPSDAPVQRPTVDDIGCDTMLDPLVDEALRSTQLTPAPKPWTQFGFEPTGAAIECPWGYAGQMHSVTYYAWAALEAGEGEQFLALTAENGYTTTHDELGTWVVGSDGPSEGATEILVTDDWIAFAPTRELVSAILWTR